MTVGEPCGFEGQNIKVTSDNMSTDYLGCFADNGKVVGLDKNYGNNLSLAECSQKAMNNGYKYVGYHEGTGCYGSNSYPNDGQDESQCIVDGDHKEGQYIYNSIYEINDKQ